MHFLALSLLRPRKMSWNLLKTWSWNFTSCYWDPCVYWHSEHLKVIHNQVVFNDHEDWSLLFTFLLIWLWTVAPSTVSGNFLLTVLLKVGMTVCNDVLSWHQHMTNKSNFCPCYLLSSIWTVYKKLLVVVSFVHRCRYVPVMFFARDINITILLSDLKWLITVLCSCSLKQWKTELCHIFFVCIGLHN